MKSIRLKQILLIIITTICFMVLYNLETNAQSIITDKYDLDLNGNKEWVKLYVDKPSNDISIPLYMEISYNVPGDVVPYSYDGIDIPNENGLVYEKVKIIDINPKDKQKEILLLLSSYDYPYTEAQIYSFKNEKLELLGKIEGVVNIENLGVNKKLNRLETIMEGNYPFQCNYYEKYIIENGKLKNVTGNDVNISYFNNKVALKSQKNINAYTNNKFNKKAFSVKSGESITIISANKNSNYIKIKNSAGKIGYLQTVKFNDFQYALKQYPDVPIEGSSTSPFSGTQHWN